MTSTVLRRLIRPRGRVVRQLGFSGEHRRSALMARVNAREVSAAPPPAPPAGAITAEAVTNSITGGGRSAQIGGGTPTSHGPIVHGGTVFQPTVLQPITPEPAPHRPTTHGPAIPGRIGHDVTIGGGTFDSDAGDAPCDRCDGCQTS